MPKSVTKDESDIESALEEYTKDVITDRKGLSDIWYDGNGKTKAEGLAESLTTGGKTSSLMFGIQ